MRHIWDKISRIELPFLILRKESKRQYSNSNRQEKEKDFFHHGIRLGDKKMESKAKIQYEIIVENDATVSWNSLAN